MFPEQTKELNERHRIEQSIEWKANERPHTTQPTDKQMVESADRSSPPKEQKEEHKLIKATSITTPRTLVCLSLSEI